MTLRMISHDPVHPHQAQCDHNCNQAQCKGLLAVALGAPSEPSGQGFDAQLLHRIMDQVLFIIIKMIVMIRIITFIIIAKSC